MKRNEIDRRPDRANVAYNAQLDDNYYGYIMRTRIRTFKKSSQKTNSSDEKTP